MSTMELGDRLVHVRSTVKHEKPEKELFTQDDIVFIFSDIVRPVGLILNMIMTHWNVLCCSLLQHLCRILLICLRTPHG